MKGFVITILLFMVFIGFLFNWLLMVVALGFAGIIGCLPSKKSEPRKTIIRTKDELDRWQRARALEWQDEERDHRRGR